MEHPSFSGQFTQMAKVMPDLEASVMYRLTYEAELLFSD